MPENVTLLQVQGSGTEIMCLGTVIAESLPQQYKELFYPIMQCTLLKNGNWAHVSKLQELESGWLAGPSGKSHIIPGDHKYCKVEPRSIQL